LASWGEEITWIQGSRPNLVIVKGNGWVGKAHYFYFAVELGERPISDVEPVRVASGLLAEDHYIVLTRVHFNILVMWISPRIVEKLPLTRFLLATHTPFILSQDFKYKIEKIEDAPVEWWKQFKYSMGWLWLLLFLKKPERAELDESKEMYSDRIVADVTFLEKYKKGEILFDFGYLKDKAKELAVIGSEREAAETIENIKGRGKGRLTVDAIMEFLNDFVLGKREEKGKEHLGIEEHEDYVKVGGVKLRIGKENNA